MLGAVEINITLHFDYPYLYPYLCEGENCDLVRNCDLLVSNQDDYEDVDLITDPLNQDCCVFSKGYSHSVYAIGPMHDHIYTTYYDSEYTIDLLRNYNYVAINDLFSLRVRNGVVHDASSINLAVRESDPLNGSDSQYNEVILRSRYYTISGKITRGYLYGKFDKIVINMDFY